MRARPSSADFSEAAIGALAGLTALARATDPEKGLADLSPRGASRQAYASLADPFGESAAMFAFIALAAVNGSNRAGGPPPFAPPPLPAPGE
jgi:hypothetical protein